MTPSTTFLLIHLQSTTNQIHRSPSPLYCHGNESGSSFGIMKLLHDLEVGEMIHIYVRVGHGNCSVNWEPITPHKKLSWLGPIVTGPIKPCPWHLSHLTKGPSFLLFPAQMNRLGGCFSARLLFSPSTGVGSSSMSSPPSASTFTCTPVNRNAALSSLFVTVWSWLGIRNL